MKFGLFELILSMMVLLLAQLPVQAEIQELSQEMSQKTNGTKQILKAAYFSGKEIIRYKQLSLSLTNFTIELSVKIEGGQLDNVPIFRLYDRCIPNDPIELIVGIKEKQVGQNLRFYCSLKSDGKNEVVTLVSHKPLIPDKWQQLTVIYDGEKMKMFVNNAKVDVSSLHPGLFLKNVFENCVTLDIGGDFRSKKTFRGTLTDVRIFNISKSHLGVTNNSPMNTLNDLVFYEKFLKKRFQSLTVFLPVIKDIYAKKETIDISIPECGLDICDNPEVISNYADVRKQLVTLKTIKYRIINLMDDDYKNAMFSDEILLKNNKLLNEIFRIYNVTFEYHQEKVNNTYLRNKTIIIDCYGHCEGDALSHCNVESKPNDCKKTCSIRDIGNGICNPECNKPSQYTMEGHLLGLNFRWDGGDCCQPQRKDISKTCYDYKSPWRAFLQESELKEIINLDNENYLNIFPVNIKPNVLGKSTFPWDPKRYEISGGILTNANEFANGNIIDLIHEIGHAFGLWHVHKGVSEVTGCNDPCSENYPSMTHGDLCSDTNPTPGNRFCNDSVVDTKCSKKRYTQVPYNNYMGYTSGDCANEFTKQQMARMHCYIDKYYQIWTVKLQAPSKIPLPPRVSSFNDKELKITWMKPIGQGSMLIKNKCQLCTELNELEQYVFQSFSPTDKEKEEVLVSTKHMSKEFNGPPDVQHRCKADERAWVPQSLCTNKKPCYIEATFKSPVRPSYIQLWVTYKTGHTISDIEFLTTTNKRISIGGAITQCDVPYTKEIHIEYYIKAVRIYVTSSMVGLDAIMVRSVAFHPSCKICEKLRPSYRVYRKPAFKSSKYIITNKTSYKEHFISRLNHSVSDNITYQYSIAASSGEWLSLLSLPLIFKTTDGFCGDGKIEKHQGEECDDGNIRNGDGCDVECQEEKVFNCKLEPSLCYRYDTDGICEDFERESNTKECGIFTPNDYMDQWASFVSGAKGQSSKKCSERSVEGPPQRYLKCVGASDGIDTKAWKPCKRKYSKNSRIKNYILHLKYLKKVHPVAVVIYLASDGATAYRSSFLKVYIIDINGTEHAVSHGRFLLSCDHNPLVVSLNQTIQNLTTQSVKITFDSMYWRIAISAIALRSKKGNCLPGETYNKVLNTCLLQTDVSGSCKPFHDNNAVYSCYLKDGVTICNVSCNKGFLPEKGFIGYCLNGKWKNIIKCKARDCGVPTITNAQVQDCSHTTFGSNCTFDCIYNSVFSGVTQQIECNALGVWESRGFCYKSCATNLIIGENIRHHLNESTTCYQLSLKDEFMMGTWCSISCPLGYIVSTKLQNTQFNYDHINAICEANGQWRTDNTCSKIKCRALTSFESFIYTCSENNNYKSICTTFCMSNQSTPYQVECLSNGSWSSHFNHCNKDVQCTPPNFNNTDIDFSSCSANTAGLTCQPRCQSRGKTSSKLDVAIKGNEGYDNEVKLYCMPNGKWLPAPSNLYCVHSCIVEEFKNDWCDCHNNNKHCKYDGGDCCPYTPLNSCPCIDPTKLTHIDDKTIDKGSGDVSGDGLEIDTEDGDDDYY